uniref:MYND-type domain-containing protein n=1 Tax=Emiliania huxleyi TaxID=2903 RepID=A0A7S3SZA6_EMIHU
MPWTRPGRCHAPPRMLDPASFFAASHPAGFVRAATEGAVSASRASSSRAAAADGTFSNAEAWAAGGGWTGRAVAAHVALLAASLSSAAKPAAPNPLYELWRLRWAEAATLLHGGGLASAAQYAKARPAGRAARDKEPPAPPLVRRWRRGEREWPCWLLAFAVPSAEALAAVSELGLPVVEMGGGVGYWAALLRRRGVAVECFDSAPTEAGGKGGKGGESGNTFHGECPPWGPVQRGSSALLASRRFRRHALLLCYPPPRAPMAAECLAAFCGDTVVHVGEWLGDTGSAAFEAALAEGWELTRRLPLPCWGDTAEDLTIWRRRGGGVPRGGGAAADHPVLRCDSCGKAGSLQPATVRDKPGLLRRCRYCRLACYCSAACARRGDAEHKKCHAVRMIGAPPPADFGGPEYHTCCV